MATAEIIGIGQLHDHTRYNLMVPLKNEKI